MEIDQLRGLIGTLSWLAKETRCDLSGHVALVQQSLPHPKIHDLLQANQIAKEALKFSNLGILVRYINPQRIRAGVVTDAAWGNALQPEITDGKKGVSARLLGRTSRSLGTTSQATKKSDLPSWNLLRSRSRPGPSRYFTTTYHLHPTTQPEDANHNGPVAPKGRHQDDWRRQLDRHHYILQVPVWTKTYRDPWRV